MLLKFHPPLQTNLLEIWTQLHSWRYGLDSGGHLLWIYFQLIAMSYIARQDQICCDISDPLDRLRQTDHFGKFEKVLNKILPPKRWKEENGGKMEEASRNIPITYQHWLHSLVRCFLKDFHHNLKTRQAKLIWWKRGRPHAKPNPIQRISCFGKSGANQRRVCVLSCFWDSKYCFKSRL